MLDPNLKYNKTKLKKKRKKIIYFANKKESCINNILYLFLSSEVVSKCFNVAKSIVHERKANINLLEPNHIFTDALTRNNKNGTLI